MTPYIKIESKLFKVGDRCRYGKSTCQIIGYSYNRADKSIGYNVRFDGSGNLCYNLPGSQLEKL